MVEFFRSASHITSDAVYAVLQLPSLNQILILPPKHQPGCVMSMSHSLSAASSAMYRRAACSAVSPPSLPTFHAMRCPLAVGGVGGFSSADLRSAVLIIDKDNGGEVSPSLASECLWQVRPMSCQHQ